MALRSMLPRHVDVGFLIAAALAWFARSGDRVPAEMMWGLFEPATLGLVASFVLHESAHVAVLKRVGTVTRIAPDRTAWRTSVTPEGALTARESAAVALAGPCSCVLVGAVLWLSGLDRFLAWWYLAHALFLLPCFGDGRALLHSARAARGRSGEGDDGTPEGRY